MNSVEIESAVSELAQQPFDKAEFPYAFLQAFGNKETTLKRLRSGASTKSDVGGVLQTNNIHIAVAEPGQVTHTLAALKASPAIARAKAKFVLATDGDAFEAEDWKTKTEARLAVFTWIEAWYNPHRLHSGICYLSPVEFEKSLQKQEISTAECKCLA